MYAALVSDLYSKKNKINTTGLKETLNNHKWAHCTSFSDAVVEVQVFFWLFLVSFQ